MKTVLTVIQVLAFGSLLVMCILIWIAMELKHQGVAAIAMVFMGMVAGFFFSMAIIRLFWKDSPSGSNAQS